MDKGHGQTTQEGTHEGVIHDFDKMDSLVPLRILLNDSPGKRSVLVIGEDRRQWRIFNLEQEEGWQERKQMSDFMARSHKSKKKTKKTASVDAMAVD